MPKLAFLPRNGPSKEARRLVLDILRSQQSPLSTHDLFRLAVKQESTVQGTPTTHIAEQTGNEPRYPSHHIKSISYLKRTVLPSLADTFDVEKVHFKQQLTPEEIVQRLATLTKSARKNAGAAQPTAVDVWKWQLCATKPERPAPEPAQEPYGLEVGVDEDISHLNKRRQRSRIQKVTRDVRWMRKLELAKLEGLQTSAEELAS